MNSPKISVECYLIYNFCYENNDVFSRHKLYYQFTHSFQYHVCSMQIISCTFSFLDCYSVPPLSDNLTARLAQLYFNIAVPHIIDVRFICDPLTPVLVILNLFSILVLFTVT